MDVTGIHCLLPFLRKFKVFTGLCYPCHSSLTNSFLGGNWRDWERIETAVLPKNLHKWLQLHSQPMAVWITTNSYLGASYVLKRITFLIFERLQTMTFIERSKTGFKLQSKKQWLRLSLRIIEYATNTCKKYFYTFRINQISFNYGERKKEQNNFYRQVKLCWFPSLSLPHWKKNATTMQRKPSVLHARNIHRIIRRSNTLNKTCQLRRFAYLKVNFLVALVFTLTFI